MANDTTSQVNWLTIGCNSIERHPLFVFFNNERDRAMQPVPIRLSSFMPPVVI